MRDVRYEVAANRLESAACRQVHHREHSAAVGKGPHGDQQRSFTQRELEVLRVATEGLTARQIGHRLGVRERTVTTHLAHIYRKLGTGSRVAAITAAARSGLVSVGPAE